MAKMPAKPSTFNLGRHKAAIANRLMKGEARAKNKERPAMKAYEVKKMAYDAARPYAVIFTLRTFNRVIARYEDETAAKRRARDLNHAWEG